MPKPAHYKALRDKLPPRQNRLATMNSLCSLRLPSYIYSPVRFTPAIGVMSGAHYRTLLMFFTSPHSLTKFVGSPNAPLVPSSVIESYKCDCTHFRVVAVKIQRTSIAQGDMRSGGNRLRSTLGECNEQNEIYKISCPLGHRRYKILNY